MKDDNIVYLIDFMERFILPQNVDLQADRKTDASDHADFMHEMEKMRIKAKSYFPTGFDSQTIWEAAIEKNMVVLIDANVILDYAVSRKPYYHDA